MVIRSATAELKFVVFEPMRRMLPPLGEKEKQDSWNEGGDWRHQNRKSKELGLRIESYCGGRAWRKRRQLGVDDPLLT